MADLSPEELAAIQDAVQQRVKPPRPRATIAIDSEETPRHLRFTRDVTSLDPRAGRAIAVTGGKGGVGKSQIAASLAVAYSRRGSNVLLFDADLGMADLNLLLGVAPERTMLDVLEGADVAEVLVEAHGLNLLPAQSGSIALERIDDIGRARLIEVLGSLSDRFDTLVIDIGAGIGANQNGFAGAAGDVVVVASPEALSMAGAYACLKALVQTQGVDHAYLVPNRVKSACDVDLITGRLSSLVARFLDIELTLLTAIPDDASIPEAAEHGVPFLLYNPDSPASRAIRQLARELDAAGAERRKRKPARRSLARLFDREAHR